MRYLPNDCLTNPYKLGIAPNAPNRPCHAEANSNLYPQMPLSQKPISQLVPTAIKKALQAKARSAAHVNVLCRTQSEKQTAVSTPLCHSLPISPRFLVSNLVFNLVSKCHTNQSKQSRTHCSHNSPKSRIFTLL